jgi:hypothetical protein
MAKWSSKSIHWEGFLTFQIACPNFRNAKSKVKTFELRILENEEKEMTQMFQNHDVCVLNKTLTSKQPCKYKKLNSMRKQK